MNRYIEQFLRLVNHPYAKVAAGVTFAIIGGVSLVRGLTRLNKDKQSNDSKPE